MKNRCKICGNAVEEEEFVVCKNCRDMAKTFDNALCIGRSWQEQIPINGFWTFCFTREEIDDILYGAFVRMTEEEQKKLISDFCEEDVLYFVIKPNSFEGFAEAYFETFVEGFAPHGAFETSA